MRRFAIIALLIAGCGQSAPPVSVAPNSDSLLMMLALEDVDLSTYQPALVDDFKKPSPGTTTPDTTGREPATQPNSLPVVLVRVYSTPNHPVVEKMKNEIPGLTVYINPPPASGRFEFRFMKERPSWTDGHIFPVLHFEASPGKWMSIDGWRGLDNFLKEYTKSKGKAVSGRYFLDGVPIEHVREPDLTKVEAHYPVRGGWWSGCDSWSHMLSGEHAGKFKSDYLVLLSWPELQSLHSDAHEGRVKWQYVNRLTERKQPAMASAAPRVRYRAPSNCPNGRCPL